MTKKEFEKIDFVALGGKVRRFYEASDSQGFYDLFGKCKDIEDIKETAEALYNEFFDEE